MRNNNRELALRVLVSLFAAITIGFLVVIAILMLVQRDFPFDLGIVRTVGRAGLPATMLPAAVAVLGVVLIWRRRRLGGVLLAAYSAYWAIVFLAGLPRIWNARQSFCLKGLNFCIVSPWVARLTVLAIVVPFALAAWWSIRQARQAALKAASR